MPDLTVNGVDLSTLALELTGLEAYLDSPEEEFDGLLLNQIPGAVAVNLREMPRAVQATGLIKGTDAADARDKLRRVKWVLTSTQPSSLVFGDDVTRRLLARCRQVSGYGITGFNSSIMAVKIAWDVLQPPFFLDVTQQNVGSVTTTPVDLPQGNTRPWDVVAKVQGAASSPIRIIFSDHNAADVHEVRFNTTLGASDWLVLELGPQRVTAYKNTTGNVREGTPVWDEWDSSNGDDVFVPFELSWWDFEASDWMQVRCTAGTLQMLYYRGWK